MTMITKCKDCVYFIKRIPGYGECRRSPPQMLMRVNTNSGGYITSHVDTHWPSVKEIEGCGEGKVKSD